MRYPKIIRNRYRVGEKDNRQHSPYHLEEDFQYFHLPLSYLHQQHLHTWGICAGLEVTGTPGADLVTIQPGVAIDAAGRMIVLADEGMAETADGTVTKLPVELLLHQQVGECYVTLAYAEDEQPERPGTAGQTLPVNVLQRPFVGLEAVENFVDNGAALILAIVEIDAEHRLVQIREGFDGLSNRRLVGQSVGALELRRPATVDNQVLAVSAGTLTALPAGGLQLRVANSTDPIDLSGPNGDNFAELRIRAHATQMQGTLTLQGALAVGETLQVTGATRLNGGLTVDTVMADNFHLLSATGRERLLRVVAGNQPQDHAIHLLPDGGNVGIGTTQPGYKLDIQGTLNARELYIDGLPFPSLLPAPSQWTTVADGIAFSNGNVGIGTSSPYYNLQIGHVVKGISFDTADVTPNAGYIRFGDNTGWKLHFGRSKEKVGATPNRGPDGLLLTIQDNGNVGIGTTAPIFGLDVRGYAQGWIGSGDSSQSIGGWRLGRWPDYGGNTWVYLSRADSSHYQDLAVGTLWAGGDLRFGSADDLAEMTPVRAEDDLEAGDVVSIDEPPDDRVLLAKSRLPYDRKVAGVISDPTLAGLIIGGSHPTDIRHNAVKPIALAGRVLTKVTTENGSIRAGDLLTTAATAGYAMKATAPGWILGKALQSLTADQSGFTTGKIWVYVNLGWCGQQDELT